MTASTEPGPVHVYLSTACLHGRHDHCSSQVGTQGDKRPHTCKFCDAQCICECHGAAAAATRVVNA